MGPSKLVPVRIAATRAQDAGVSVDRIAHAVVISKRAGTPYTVHCSLASGGEVRGGDRAIIQS